MEKYIIAKHTHIGYVHLNVSDVEKLTNFYTKKIGFKIADKGEDTVSLSSSGSEPYHLKLTETKEFKKPSRNSTGLFHVAIKVTSRKELAQTLARLGKFDVKFQGFSDHGVSEAIYLADPDGNGIEIYCDKPKDSWLYNENEIEMFTAPLNINSLLNEISKSDLEAYSLSPQTCIGHVHLKVSNLEKAKLFYCDAFGFEITQTSYPGALFISAGGYHHHIGLNTWSSKDGSPVSEDLLGLNAFNIVVPSTEIIEMLKERASSFNIKTENIFTGNISSIVIHDPDEIKIEISRKK